MAECFVSHIAKKIKSILNNGLTSFWKYGIFESRTLYSYDASDGYIYGFSGTTYTASINRTETVVENGVTYYALKISGVSQGTGPKTGWVSLDPAGPWYYSVETVGTTGIRKNQTYGNIKPHYKEIVGIAFSENASDFPDGGVHTDGYYYTKKPSSEIFK